MTLRIVRILLLAAVVALTFAISKPRPGWQGWFGVVARLFVLGLYIGWQLAEHYALADRWAARRKR